jgi:hypothetical protein
MKNKLHLISICLSVCALAIASVVQFSNIGRDTHTRNMANTLLPVLAALADTACYPNGSDYQRTGQSSSIIYKRAPANNCTGGVGNYLYARCYVAKWNELQLTYTPTKDVPLPGDNLSCIDESKVSIPYYDERLAKSEIGKSYVVADHSKL